MKNAMWKVLVPSWVAVLLVVRTAGAQATGKGMNESGTFILSAERLFGLSFWSIKQDVPASPFNAGGTQTTSGTQISLLFSSPAIGVSAIALPYQTPRLAFDYTVIEGLTVGGAIGYVSATGQQESTDGVTRDTPSASAFVFAPRVGYALRLADWIYFWPRLGITYFNASTETTNQPSGVTLTDSVHGFAIDIEPAFVFSPVPHFGITVVPVADIPLSGTSKNEQLIGGQLGSTETDVTIRNFGATVGLLGYF